MNVERNKSNSNSTAEDSSSRKGFGDVASGKPVKIWNFTGKKTQRYGFGVVCGIPKGKEARVKVTSI